MVGATKGSMTQSENLFATPARPERLRIIVERLWVAGDDVIEVSSSTTATKGPRPTWGDSQTLAGPDVNVVACAAVEAKILRFFSAGWDVQPRLATYDQWLQHWGAK